MSGAVPKKKERSLPGKRVTGVQRPRQEATLICRLLIPIDSIGWQHTVLQAHAPNGKTCMAAPWFVNFSKLHALAAQGPGGVPGRE